jgi:hypothetical protein
MKLEVCDKMKEKENINHIADEEHLNQAMRDGTIDSYIFYGNKDEN